MGYDETKWQIFRRPALVLETGDLQIKVLERSEGVGIESSVVVQSRKRQRSIGMVCEGNKGGILGGVLCAGVNGSRDGIALEKLIYQRSKGLV